MYKNSVNRANFVPRIDGGRKLKKIWLLCEAATRNIVIFHLALLIMGTC